MWTQRFSGLIAIHFFNSHLDVLNFHLKQALIIFRGISFNYTYRFHFVLLFRIYFDNNLFYPEVQEANSLVKPKSSTQASSQFTEYVQHQVLHQTQQQIQKFLLFPFLFCHRTTTLSQRKITISCGWILFSKTSVCTKGQVFLYNKKRLIYWY